MTAAQYSTRLHLPLPAGGDYDTRANHNELVDRAELYVADKTTVDTHVAAAAPHSGHETPAGSQTKVDTHNADPNAHSGVAKLTDLNTHKTANPIDHPAGSVGDTAIGNRTLDPSSAPSGNGPSALTAILGYLANRIKAITGTTNWWDAPAITLSATKAATDSSSAHISSNSQHGVSGSVVGTTDTQTLTDKTLSTGTKLATTIVVEVNATYDLVSASANPNLELWLIANGADRAIGVVAAGGSLYVGQVAYTSTSRFTLVNGDALHCWSNGTNWRAIG